MKNITILLLPPVVIGLLLCLHVLLPLSAHFFGPLRTIYGLNDTKNTTGKEPLLSEIIERERAKWKLPKGIIEGLIMHESKFDEKAFNPEKQSRCYKTAKSESAKRACGSVGLMQVVPRWHGGSSGDDYGQHVARGAKVLGRPFSRTRNIILALSEYNGDRSGKYARAVIREAKRFGYKG